jgi:hypothetical protein
MRIPPVLTLLVIAAVVLQVLGGTLDLYKKDSIYGMSKQHLWADGIFLLGLAIFLGHYVR